MGRGDRPEHTAPPEIFYGEDEARKYTTNTRMMAIQARAGYQHCCTCTSCSKSFTAPKHAMLPKHFVQPKLSFHTGAHRSEAPVEHAGGANRAGIGAASSAR